MLYIKASFVGENYQIVGKAETLEESLKFADNIGDIFSCGLTPQTVDVAVTNEKDTVVFRQESYNGYHKMLYTDETVLNLIWERERRQFGRPIWERG